MQAIVADRDHPAVRAIAPLFCEFDQYAQIIAPGGVPHTRWLENWGRLIRALDAGNFPADDWRAKLFVRGVRQPARGLWLGYAVVAAVALYTNLSAVFVFACHGLVYAVLFARRRLGKPPDGDRYPGAAETWPWLGFVLASQTAAACAYDKLTNTTRLVEFTIWRLR